MYLILRCAQTRKNAHRNRYKKIIRPKEVQLSSFDNVYYLLRDSKVELHEEEKEMAGGLIPPLPAVPGISVDTPVTTLEQVYTRSWDSAALKLLELGESEELLKECLKRHYRAHDMWGLYLPLFGTVHVSYLPDLYNKALEYFEN